MTPSPERPTVFQAIADPRRRALLGRLRRGERSVNELARPFPVSRPAISQHLALLRRAGLVAVRRQGREHYYRLRPARLRVVRDWVAHYEEFWRGKMEALGKHLEGKP